MRLCFISNPNSTHTRRWVDWFARRGHTVSLIADESPRMPWTGIELFDLPRRFNQPVLRYLPWAAWTRQIIRRWQPDILHAHRVSSAGWLGAFAGFHPLVVTPWGSDLYQYPQRSRVARWLARFVLRQADLVTADAQDLLQTALRYGATPELLRLVQWGVDLAHFHPGAADQNLRAELRLGAGPVVLSPRGVNPIYNLDTIIQALPAVRAAVPGAMLLLRDYNTDAVYKKRLEEMIAALELTEAVRWLGAIEPWERVADIYRLADVVVSVPASDSTPVSVLEALACGVPVIATDLPAQREWVTSGENGILIPQRDPQALAAALCLVLTNPEMAGRFRLAGPILVEKKANHQVEMEKMEAFYRGLV